MPRRALAVLTLLVSWLAVSGALAAGAGDGAVVEAAPPAPAAGAPADVDIGEEVPPAPVANAEYGVAARLRWVTVPAFMLNIFTKKNVPLSSWGTGVELARRKGNFELVVSFSYEDLSPSDGNWLGNSHSAITDTDYTQFRSFALYGIDASFIWHSFIKQWLGLHYGAGFGIGIVGGHILRTPDNDGMCTEANAGDVSQCHPANVTCTGSSCNDAQLGAAGRLVSGDVPPVVPIINLLVGVDFRVPRLRGWEARIEGGFYDALFLGGTVGYLF